MSDRQRGLIFLLIIPFNYVYGLLENHFSSHRLLKVYHYDFWLEIKNGVRVALGKDYKDDSTKLAEYEYYCKAKKAKIDVKVADKMKDTFGRYKLNFHYKTNSINYKGFNEEDRFHIYKIENNKYKVKYYKYTGWNDKHYYESELPLTIEEVCVIIDVYKKIGSE